MPTTTSAVDANDRLTSDAYDPNGNTSSSNGNSYQYDFENRLLKLNAGMAGEVTFVYDGDGHRVGKIIAGVTTKYLVDTNNPTGYAQVVEELTSGAVSRVYVYGHMRISQQQLISGNWVSSFYGYDGHGSVRFLTDGTGTITDSYTYDAFGVLVNRTGTTANDYLYAGEPFDTQLGLYYNRARYLNTATGRFWTMDSFEGFENEPLSLHKYFYVHANPVNNTDPTGHLLAPVGGVAELNATAASRETIESISVPIWKKVVAAVLASVLVVTVTLAPFATKSDERVYRGTDRTAENEIYDETGHILSDAAQEAYKETGSLSQAYEVAQKTHLEWINEWGSELLYATAHAEYGTEMPREFGRKRTFVSVTKFLDKAESFATPQGRIYFADIPRYLLLPQPLQGANEGEYLIRLGSGDFRVYRK